MAALVAVIVPTLALGAFPDSDVKSYTGCLSLTTGSISAVAEGNAPKAACSGTQVAIHLSGGDMTATRTPAAGGLQGGTENGAASLELQPGYKLPQGCADGQLPKWSSSSWQCASDTGGSGDITAVRTPADSGLEGGAESGDVNLGLGASFKLPQSCGTGQVTKWNGSSWSCADDVDTNSGGDITGVNAGTGLTGGGSAGDVDVDLSPTYQLPQTCVSGQVAKWNGADWSCAADDDQTYSGADFALSNQDCGSGNFARAITTTGQVQCAADSDHTYTGADFALSNQDCGSSNVASGITGTGQLQCVADQNTTYSGANFATSGQDCPASQFANGINLTGGLKCAAPPTGSGGTTGQDADTVYGTTSLHVTNATPLTLVPGLTQTITVPANTVLWIHTDGGIATDATATNGFSMVDVAVFIDGSVPTNGAFKRLIAANTTGLTNMFSYWAIGFSVQLTTGSHTILVAAGSGNSATANSSAVISGNNTSVLQGELTVETIKL